MKMYEYNLVNLTNNEEQIFNTLDQISDKIGIKKYLLDYYFKKSHTNIVIIDDYWKAIKTRIIKDSTLKSYTENMRIKNEITPINHSNKVITAEIPPSLLSDFPELKNYTLPKCMQ